MPQGKKYSFFLGANTPRGFYSAFDSLTDDKAIDQVFIIKGGPGCGKSSFMKKLGSKLIDTGADTEFIHCSSDPDSLDGIISPKAKTVICDGTSPHVTEPKYPGAFETYLNFADFWDSSKIKKNYTDIVALNSAIKQCYRRAYGFISAASKVSDEMFATILPFTEIAKIEKRTKGIISREIHNKSTSEGVVKKRFLSSFTPKGILFLSDTVSSLFNRVYRLSDTYGLSHFMLSSIVKASCAAGHDTYVCYCPMNPEGKIDHVLIPDLSLAFVTTNDNLPYSDDSDRHIRLDAYINRDQYLDTRDQLRQWKKNYQLLLDQALQSIHTANSFHDKLETYYVPAMDFSKVNKLFDELCPKILDRMN
ncbi:MAG: hypothetical protein N2Z65_07575 [Clostridiales bacterium]|nr:hypothetical protein [Clostridiales bacterium]